MQEKNPHKFIIELVFLPSSLMEALHFQHTKKNSFLSPTDIHFRPENFFQITRWEAEGRTFTQRLPLFHPQADIEMWAWEKPLILWGKLKRSLNLSGKAPPQATFAITFISRADLSPLWDEVGYGVGLSYRRHSGLIPKSGTKNTATVTWVR